MTDDNVTTATAPRLIAALSFVRRGWPVVPLHDVSMGFCSCNDGSEKHAASSAGKHPIARNWQHSSITDEEIMRGFFAGRPGMNFGVKTGQQAGIWVLDVDPKHDGDKRLAELTTQHGNLPDTYTQRTGSGGLHHFWSLPVDFTPTNSRGSLPPGLDVRGEGGFVVAAPCVSGIGPYETLLDLPLAGAPEWLLDMIRPRIPADIEHRAAMRHWDHPSVAAMGERGQRYAAAVLLDELNKLANAVPGERGFTAYRVACNLLELVNSPWAGLPEDQARAGFAQAATMAMRHGGSFDEREAWAAWGSAAARVGTRGRAAPHSGAGGVLLGWNQLGGVPPFGGSLPAGREPENSMWGSIGIDSQESANFVPLNGDSGTKSSQTARDQLLSASRLRDDFPTEINHSQESANPGDLADALISKFLTMDQLAALPPPSWLINGWLTLDACSWIVGAPGSGKSFAGLSMALSVATGRAWYGQEVKQGNVGYVVAEGAAGMHKRSVAWCKTFNDGVSADAVRFLPMPVQASDFPAWDALIAAAARMRLALVVLDTQARVTVGMKENAGEDMGLFVEQVERLRRATGACVLVVHHVPKGGATLRGHGSLEGAAQTIVSVAKGTDNLVTLRVDKQKDDEPPLPKTLRLVGIGVGAAHDGWGAPEVKGAVLVNVDALDAAQEMGLNTLGKVARVLKENFANGGATKAEAKAVALDRFGVGRSAFYRAWDELEKRKLLTIVFIDDKPTTRRAFRGVDVNIPE